MTEYIAISDVKLFKSPGTLYRLTLKAGSHVFSTEGKDGWIKIDAPANYAGFWGESKYFREAQSEPPTGALPFMLQVEGYIPFNGALEPDA